METLNILEIWFNYIFDTFQILYILYIATFWENSIKPIVR